MRLQSYPENYTQAQIDALEKRIKETFAHAEKESIAEYASFTELFQSRDEKYRQMVADGDLSESEYRAWLAGQVFQDEQWKTQLDYIAKNLTHADKAAQELMRTAQYDVYAENANYNRYELEQNLGIETGWHFMNGEDVRNLLVNEPNLLPMRPVDEDGCSEWYRNHITRQITAGIIQGYGVNDIAKKIDAACSTGMRYAQLHARTAMTSAQNAGTIYAMQDAYEKYGINYDKQWSSVLDMRTRVSHQHMDGQIVGWNEMFSNGLEYPADPNGKPEEIYNCRCALKYVIKGFQSKTAKRLDSITGQRIEWMPYDEWKESWQNVPQTDTRYLRTIFPSDFVDTRTIGEPISEVKLKQLAERASKANVVFGDPNNKKKPYGGFETYCGDPSVLDDALLHIERTRSDGIYSGKIILRYGYAYNMHGVVSIDTFAFTKGNTITLNKFMFDDSAFLHREYMDAVRNHKFPYGTTERNVIDHEIGHLFDESVYEKLIYEYTKEAKNGNISLEEYIKKNVSRYAAICDFDGVFFELVPEVNSMNASIKGGEFHADQQ